MGASDDSGEAQAVVASGQGAVAYLAAFLRNPLETVPPEAYHRGLVTTRLLGQTRVYVTDPALIHEALVRQADALSKGAVFRRVLGPALGNGLLTAEGAMWRWQRRSASPAFQQARLLGFQPAMIAAAEAARDRWLARGAGVAVDIGHEMMRATFAIIVETMLSGAGTMDVERIEADITAYLRSTGWAGALGILRLPAWVPYPGRRRALAAAAFLRGAVSDMVAARRRRPSGRDDLVALLLAAEDPETGRTMTDGEIADNLLTFITAGHETTAQGLSWTLHLVADHPGVERRMLAEIEAVTGGGPLSPAHVEALAYTRQVFCEGMRLFPPAPLVVRRVERPFRLGPLDLAAGTLLIVPIHAVHRHRSLWEEPDRFDPDRFASDPVKARHRYSFLPFGAGPRVCIGSAFATMEAVAILAVLLPAFRLDNLAATPTPTMRVTLRPRTPIRMRLTPRSDRVQALGDMV